jgi:hypothetical protein
LIKLLKDLTAVYGESSPDQPNTYVNHSLTQQEMASLIATFHKSVSLMMNERKLKQETGKFWILDYSVFD